MSSFVDSLNLRPQEKRLIVGIAVVAFVTLNYLFVIPHFKDYARMKRELGNVLYTNTMFSAEIATDNNPTNGYKWKLDQLRKVGADSSALRFSTAIQLQTTVAKQAQEAGVSVQTYDPVNLVHLGTNAAAQFFESESIRISVEANEDSLVNFLYNVGNDPAMIRVREYDLHPVDANRYKLKGQFTLTADYKKSDKDAATKLVAAKNNMSVPNQPKVTPVNPQPTVAPPPNGRGPAAALPNGRGPFTPPPNGRGPFLPGQKTLNPNGRGQQSAPVAPPAFPSIPPRRPPPNQTPPSPGNNQ